MKDDRPSSAEVREWARVIRVSGDGPDCNCQRCRAAALLERIAEGPPDGHSYEKNHHAMNIWPVNIWPVKLQ
jgi:hypothetical protein